MKMPSSSKIIRGRACVFALRSNTYSSATGGTPGGDSATGQGWIVSSARAGRIPSNLPRWRAPRRRAFMQGSIGALAPEQPDIAGNVSQAENQAAVADLKGQRPGSDIAKRTARTVDVHHGSGGAGRPFCCRVERLAPDATEAVALGYEVHRFTIRRPALL